MADDIDWSDALDEQSSVNKSSEEKVEDTWGDALNNTSDVSKQVLSRPVPNQASQIIKNNEQSSASAADSGTTQSDTVPGALDKCILEDIPMDVSIVAGGTKMVVKDLLRLNQGSVVELSSNHDDPFLLLVNGQLLAKGQLVLINDKMGFRVTEVINPRERLEQQKKLT